MKFLMHSAMPLDVRMTEDKLEVHQNHNIGALVHQYALWKTLECEENIIEFANFFQFNNPIEDAKGLNEKYDCIVFSLGDFFRTDILKRDKFENILLLLQNLTIKVLVVGIGCRRRYWQSIETYIKDLNMGEAIKSFVSECLKHTNIIGIRGNDTATILNRLGFIENKDYYICGCPSMFLNDDKLLIPTSVEWREDIKIATNRNFNIGKKYPGALNFFHVNVLRYKNCDTIFTWYFDVLNNIHKTNKYGLTAVKPDYIYYKLLKYKYCLNIDEYFELLKNYDVCIGERMHGCAAAIAAGVPTIIGCMDYRMVELCEYHKIPYFNIANVNENIDFKYLIQNINFNSMHKVHKINFERYKYFFQMNEIPTKYGLKKENN